MFCFCIMFTIPLAFFRKAPTDPTIILEFRVSSHSNGGSVIINEIDVIETIGGVDTQLSFTYNLSNSNYTTNGNASTILSNQSNPSTYTNTDYISWNNSDITLDQTLFTIQFQTTNILLREIQYVRVYHDTPNNTPIYNIYRDGIQVLAHTLDYDDNEYTSISTSLLPSPNYLTFSNVLPPYELRMNYETQTHNYHNPGNVDINNYPNKTGPNSNNGSITSDTLLDGTSGYVMQQNRYSYYQLQDNVNNTNTLHTMSIILKNRSSISSNLYEGNVPSADNFVVLFGHLGNETNNIYVKLNNDKTLSLRYYYKIRPPGGDMQHTNEQLGEKSEITFNEDSYNMIVLTRSSDFLTYKVYLNGELAITHQLPDEDKMVNVGSYNYVRDLYERNNNVNIRGLFRIQEIRMFEEVLTDIEVSTLYQDFI